LKKQPKKKSRKGEKNEKPLSLFTMTFNQAVGKLLAAKPKSKQKRPKKEASQ
jgi:hypothetical protein